MTSIWDNIVRSVKEYFGSRNLPVAYPFSSSEVISPPAVVRVGLLTQSYYLNLHPTSCAVLVSGGKFQSLKGGYNFPLAPGKYSLYYVDKKDRVHIMEKVSETTRDGARIALTLVILYRVSDPIRVFEIQQPLDTLFAVIQSDLKEFIRIHRHDEIIGTSDTQTIDASVVARYIKQQHAGRHHMAKIFTILDVVVEGKEGDPRLTEIKKDFQVQQSQNTANTELLKQKQELERKVADQESEIKRIKAEADVRDQTIRRKMREQEIELENLRRNSRWPQERLQRTFGVLSELVSNPNYLNTQEIANTARALFAAMQNQDVPVTVSEPPAAGTSASQAPQPSAPPATDKVDLYTEQLLKMIERRKGQG